MNEKSFALIACVTDEELWRQCEKYIEEMIVPQGYSIDVIKLTGATSIMHAYNQAMKKSKAKYKIYFHQDTFILNRNLLNDLLQLFQNSKLGMVGVQGGTRIPKSGVWFHDGLHSFGTILRIGTIGGIGGKLIPPRWNKRKVRKMSYLPIFKPYLPVACIDGLMMATQYDLPWREDLFEGFIYYEGPHCLEFIKKGYHVVVPRQKEPWCLHVGADRTVEEDKSYHKKFRQVMGIFKKEYSAFLNKHIREIERIQKA